MPGGRLPLHRPRRPVLADGQQLELHDEFERAGLLALLGMGSSPGKTNVMAVAAVRELGAQPERVDVFAAGRDIDPPPAARPTPTRCRRSSTS